MDLVKKIAGVKGGGKLLSPFILQLLVIMFVMEFVKGSLIVTILPDYMGSVLGLSAFAIGLTLSLQYIGDNVFRSPIGWLIDRIGYRWCVLFGAVFTFLAVIVLATQQELNWIITASVLLGIGTSPLWPAVIAGATESIGVQAKGTLMSIIYLSWLSGIGLGPIVINFFIHYSYDAAFRLLIVLMTLVTLLALFLPGKLKRSTNQDRSEEDGQPLKLDISRRERVIQYFVNVRNSLTMSRLFYVSLFAQTFALGLITPVITLYARSVLQVTPFQYSSLLAFGGGVAVVALIPMGKLVDKYGTRWFLHIGFPLGGLTLLVFTFNQDLWLLYLLVATLGIGYSMIIPAWNALIAEAVPEKERGAVWGFILTIEGTGTILGPLASGRLWDQLGFHAPFVTSGCVLLLLFVCHIFISTEKRVVVR